MKKASQIMYLLGKIFTIIGLVANALGISLGYFCMTSSSQVYQKLIELDPSVNITPEQIKEAGFLLIIGCALAIVFAIVILCLIEKARRAVEENKEAKGLHIALIVLGALNSLLILLGGAFALAAYKEPEEPKQE